MAMKNSNKRQLITSMMSLGLSVTMLMGTTLAWFTDSATSKGNIINAGTLKVKLTHEGENGEEDVHIRSTTNNNHQIFDYANWEPNYTNVETLTITNGGSLALKYALDAYRQSTSDIDQVVKLSDVIDVYVCEGVVGDEDTSIEAIKSNTKWTLKCTLTEWLEGQSLITGTLESGQSRTVSVALHMRDNAGNEYQNLPLGNINIELNAEQWTHEKDSFGNQYDKQYDNVVNVSSTDALETQLNNAEDNTVIYLEPGVYEEIQLESSIARRTQHNIKNLRIVGQEGVKIKGLTIKNDANNSWIIDGLTIENVDFVGRGVYIDQKGNYAWMQMPNLTMRNCTFVGEGYNINKGSNRLLGIDGQSSTHTFKNLLIEKCTVKNAWQGIYVLQPYDATIRNCTFENIGHNAIALRANVHGTNVIENNTITNCNDRAFRVDRLEADSKITYMNNKIIGSTGDPDNGTNFKANELRDGSIVEFKDNTVNGISWADGKIEGFVSNPER